MNFSLNCLPQPLIQVGTSILLIIIILISLFPFYLLKKREVKDYKEGFLTPGNYPNNTENVLLSDTYEMVDKPGVTTYGSNDAYRDYPVYPAEFNKSNNIKYWNNPNNGTCSFLETCGGLYKNKNKNKTCDNTLVEPGWNNRVNYYN